MAGPYIAYDKDGNELFGDGVFDHHMTDHADTLGAIIRDVSTGVQVYPKTGDQVEH